MAINQPSAGQNRVTDIQGLLSIMQRHNEITELFYKQQKVSPKLDILVFNGDPLECDFFMKAFAHGIEERTNYIS